MRKYITLAIAGALALACGPATGNGNGNDQAHYESPRTEDRDCYEDEVIMWTGDDHDMCVAIDTLAAFVHPDNCEEANPETGTLECDVIHLDLRN